MDYVFPVIAVIMVLLMLPPLYRVVKGPTLFDRIMAAGLMGTNGVLILAVIGFAYGRINMFIDLAIAYALLNFIGTIAVSKYLRRHRGEVR
jgi:multicomponent Na+:H+ antiporter subunit F